MDGNANPSVEFTGHFIHLSEVQEIADKLTCADFATWRPLQAPHCQVYEPKVEVLLVYFPSLILLDTIFYTHNNKVLWLGASHLCNCCWKLCCAPVTDSVLMNDSTAALWCCTDQHSVSAKLQTSL